MNVKINKINLFAGIGSILAVVAFFVIAGANTASACAANDCVYPPLSGSCTTSISRGYEGDIVTWTYQGVGGNGYYSFRWTGTDGLSSNYPTISKRYTNAGTKTGTVEITSNHQTITRTCAVVIEKKEVEQNLDVSCVASPSNALVGNSVRYTANVSGGNGSYSYSWSGTDGLSSSSRTATKSYYSTGTKSATVTVDSGNQTRSATCSTHVEDDDNDDDDNLDGYCTGRPSNPDEDERVTWTAYPRGGDRNYDYEWSGTDSLDGDDKSVSMRYDDEGTKTARVRITDSDGESITRTCTVRVDEDNDDDLDAYCKASPDDAEVGDRIRWTVYPDGGDGDYDYEWDGDENLRGDDKSITKTYSTYGRKDAEVRVESDGDRVTVRCSVDIDREDNIYIPPKTDGGIYLSSIPATGISPTMKVTLFVVGLLMWSAFLSYLYVARKNEKMKERAVLESLGIGK